MGALRETLPSSDGKCIGVRVEPSRLRWAVVAGDASLPILLGDDKLTPPKIHAEPAALVWYRDQFAMLLDKYAVRVVAVRTAEAMATQGKRGPDRVRARIEGVVIELAARRGLRVLTGDLKVISAKIDSPKAKHYLTETELRGIALGTRDAPQREAILVATAGLTVA